MLHSPEIRHELSRQRETELLREAEKERLALLAAGNSVNLQSRLRAVRARFVSGLRRKPVPRTYPAPNPAS